MNKREKEEKLYLILEELSNAGLVEKDGDSYRISQKGRDLIELNDPNRLKSAIESHMSLFKNASLKV